MLCAGLSSGKTLGAAAGGMLCQLNNCCRRADLHTVIMDLFMERMPITAEGLARLESELKHLKNVERHDVIRAIAEAREHGDLSENAEYHAARERQGFIEGRVAELEDKISRAEVIDTSKLQGRVIKFGAYVTIVDEDTDDEATYQIVGTEEADVQQSRLSITSPLARAMIGKEPGDTIVVAAPGGSKSYEILSVQYR